ncbi:MAG: hypothetical protein ACKOBM_00080, partial [Gammaproteobacteria bacterium]
MQPSEPRPESARIRPWRKAESHPAGTLALCAAAGSIIGVSALVVPWSHDAIRALASGFTLLPALACVLVLLRVKGMRGGAGRLRGPARCRLLSLGFGIALGLGWGAIVMQSALDRRITDNPGDHAERLRVRVLDQP